MALKLWVLYLDYSYSWSFPSTSLVVPIPSSMPTNLCAPENGHQQEPSFARNYSKPQAATHPHAN